MGETITIQAKESIDDALAALFRMAGRLSEVRRQLCLVRQGDATAIMLPMVDALIVCEPQKNGNRFVIRHAGRQVLPVLDILSGPVLYDTQGKCSATTREQAALWSRIILRAGILMQDGGSQQK